MISINYGKTFIDCEPGDAAVLSSRVGELRAEAEGSDIVKAAMEAPIASPRLFELARGKKTCTIIISDHTRPVPSRDILPNMLSELRRGSPDIDVTFLVATGFHRPTTHEELMAKLGPELMDEGKIVVHDCRDEKKNVRIGTLPSGAPCVVDRTAVETELLIAEGFIEPHFFAGFSGGRKSVLPGVSGERTVMGNHCSRFINSEFSRTGILDGNPMHEDMLAAARLAGLAYIVNVVIAEDKRTVAAFAGDMEKAHRAGCEFLEKYCRVQPVPADIVVTSNGGAPLDQNIYQCVKGMTAAEASCAEGGVIILCAECADGHGGEGFYRSLAECETPAALYAKFMATPQEETLPDQWESQILCRVLIKHRVIMVTREALRETVEEMKMLWAPSLPAAMDMARGMGKKTVSYIPNGVSVIVK